MHPCSAFTRHLTYLVGLTRAQDKTSTARINLNSVKDGKTMPCLPCQGTSLSLMCISKSMSSHITYSSLAHWRFCTQNCGSNPASLIQLPSEAVDCIWASSSVVNVVDCCSLITESGSDPSCPGLLSGVDLVCYLGTVSEKLYNILVCALVCLWRMTPTAGTKIVPPSQFLLFGASQTTYQQIIECMCRMWILLILATVLIYFGVQCVSVSDCRTPFNCLISCMHSQWSGQSKNTLHDDIIIDKVYDLIFYES